MKCAQQHTADRHTRHTHICTNTQCCRLPSPGTPTAAHQRKKHSVLILIEKLLIFHASSSRDGSSRDGGSRGRPRPLLTHAHTCTQLCLLTHLHMPTHTHTHTHATASALQLLPSELFVLPILPLCVCEYVHMCVCLCVCSCAASAVFCVWVITHLCVNNFQPCSTNNFHGRSIPSERTRLGFGFGFRF